MPVHIETISGFNREFPYLQQDFWKSYPEMTAADFARFVALAKKGKPRAEWKPEDGANRQEAEKEYQLREIEKSIQYCKTELGLGLKR